MKKIIFYFLFFQSFLLYSNDLEEFWKSILVIRPGILDFGNATVEEIFKDKKFRKNKELDGTEVIVEYGEINLKGNKVEIPIIVKRNLKESTIMKFRFLYNNEYVVLYEVYYADYENFQFKTYKDFGEILYMIQLYSILIVNVVYEISKDQYWVEDYDKYYIIDENNNVISDFILYMKPEFNKDNMSFVEINNKWALITLDGKYIIKPSFDSIPIYFKNEISTTIYNYDLEKCNEFIQEIDIYLKLFNTTHEYYNILVNSRNNIISRIDFLNNQAKLYEKNKDVIDEIQLEINEIKNENIFLGDKKNQKKYIVGLVVPTIIFGVTGVVGLGILVFSSPVGKYLYPNIISYDSYDVGTPGFNMLMIGGGLLGGGISLCIPFAIVASSIKKIFNNKIQNNNNKIQNLEKNKNDLLTVSTIGIKFSYNTFEFSLSYNF